MESNDSKRNIEVAKKGITPARIYHGSKDGIFSAYNQFWSESQGVHNATVHGRLVHNVFRRGSGSSDFVSTTPLK